jgi:hypothetical protein
MSRGKPGADTRYANPMQGARDRSMPFRTEKRLGKRSRVWRAGGGTPLVHCRSRATEELVRLCGPQNG